MKREGGGEFKGLGYICNAGKRAELVYSGVAQSPPIYSSRSLYVKYIKTRELLWRLVLSFVESVKCK